MLQAVENKGKGGIMAATVTFTVNGREHKIGAAPDTPLLYVLRDALGLTGTKYGCGAETCGSCSVLIDGTRAFSCQVPVGEITGKAVVTIEGLGTGDDLHPLQRAFINEGAFQCGYCTPGMIIAASALLETDPAPDDAAIRTALQDNLCRCGSHPNVIAAVKAAAQEMAR
jgi:aerobic-type carbon monoxide dehydrogenase small subunit (CoxS/CutS family)